MPTPPRRPLAAALATGLLAAVPAVAATTAPASALTTTTTVTYDRCDVRTTANDPSTRVTPVFTWTPAVTVDITTPLQVNDTVTGRVLVDDFPAGKIPVSLSKVYAYYRGDMATTSGGTVSFGKTLPNGLDLDAGHPVPLGESERDYSFSRAGLHAWTAGEFTMNVEGYDSPNGTGTYRRYYVKCDRPATPPVPARIPVWDPAAKAALAVSSPTVVQGRTVTLTGSGFRPDEAVRFLVDDKELSSRATDLTGSAAHTWTVPPFLKPGLHTVRLSSTVSGKTVTGAVTVVAAPAGLVVRPKKVRPGKKVTLTASQLQPGEKMSVRLRRLAAGAGLKAKTFGSVTASSAGTVKKKITLPKRLGKGKHEITVTGTSSRRVGVARVNVKEPRR